jgi:hypothetical protein
MELAIAVALTRRAYPSNAPRGFPTLQSSVVPRLFLRQTQLHSPPLSQQMRHRRGSNLQQGHCRKSRIASDWVQDRNSVDPSVFLDPLHDDPSTGNANKGRRSRRGDEMRAGGVSVPVGAHIVSGIPGRGMVVAGGWRWPGEKPVERRA